MRQIQISMEKKKFKQIQTELGDVLKRVMFRVQRQSQKS